MGEKVEGGPGAHVVVIGAGVAGLAAAWRLEREGCKVTLLERSQRVGSSLVGEWVDGFSIDDTPPVVLSTDRHLLGWIAEAGLADSLLPPRPLQLTQVYRGRAYPIDTSTLSGLARIPGVRIWDTKRLLRLPRLMDRYRPLLDPDRPERAADLDYRSAADFARLYFGTSLWDYWISPAAMSEFVTDDENLSRVAFLLSRIASNDGRAVLGVLRRGLQELAVEVAAKVGVHLGAEVQALEARAGGGYLVHCGVEGMSEETRRTVEADAVVVATPAATAAKITHDVVTLGERDFFATVETGPILSLCVALDHSPAGGPQYVRVPHAESSPIECYVVESGGTGGRAPERKGLLTLFANQRFARANARATDEVIEKALLAALSRVHSREVGSVLFTRLRRREDARSLFHVRAYRELERFQRIQSDRRMHGRRLYFAGDYLAGTRPESSVSSGRRAADALLADLARDRS